MTKVCVVTQPELGWDCVIMVASTIKSAVKILNEECLTEYSLEDWQKYGYIFEEHVVKSS